MDNNNNNRKSIPFIRVDASSLANGQNSYISVSSSEESLPVDAPLVRQPRCSVDIDTLSSVMSEKSLADEIECLLNSHLESPDQQSNTMMT